MGPRLRRAWTRGSQDHVSKTGSEVRMDAYTSSLPVGTGKSFSGIKRTEREPGHSSVVSILKIYWIVFGVFRTPSWHGFRRMGNFTEVSKPISWSRLLAHKLTVVQLATKFITLNGSQRSLSCSHHCAVPWVILVQSTLLHPISWRFTLTLSSSLCPDCLQDVLLLLLSSSLLPYLSYCVFFFICCFLIFSVLVPILWQITRLLSQHINYYYYCSFVVTVANNISFGMTMLTFSWTVLS
jgi:hypothetical protein